MDASRPLAQLNPEKSGFFYVYTPEPTSTQKDVNSEGFFARESSQPGKRCKAYTFARDLSDQFVWSTKQKFARDGMTKSLKKVSLDFFIPNIISIFTI